MKYDKISGFADEIAEDVDTQFGVLRKLGIGYFEPRGIDGKNIADLSDSEVAALKEKMEREGISVSSIGSPIGKIRLDEDFEAHFERFRRVVEIAQMLDARYIRMFSFYRPAGENAGEWTAKEREEVINRLRRMIAHAKEQNVVLLHENEKDIYGDTAERCEDLMRELACEHFRAVFDPANFVQCGQDTKEAYEKLKDFVSYVHIKDAFMKDGSVVPAGSGDGNVEYILKSLFDAGYDGFLSLEPHLGSFAGLAALELDDKMLDLPQGGEGTFTLAYRALEEIIDKVK
ncbi:MAG: sugar phosphate isomerase/epimerase [Lachnospiraceae bacterium]|nr:sugar phosphate isomerase/epimerase [Lachnospiraceae bacterium]